MTLREKFSDSLDQMRNAPLNNRDAMLHALRDSHVLSGEMLLEAEERQDKRYAEWQEAANKLFEWLRAEDEQPPDEDATPKERACCQCGHGFSENEVYYSRELCAKCFGRCEKCAVGQSVRRLKAGFVEYHSAIYCMEFQQGRAGFTAKCVGPVGSDEVKDCYEPQADAPLGATRAERIALYRTAGMIVEEEGDAPSGEAPKFRQFHKPGRCDRCGRTTMTRPFQVNICAECGY